MVKYEDLLVHIGQFGRWQKLCVCLLWLPPMFAGVHNLLFVFTGLTSSEYHYGGFLGDFFFQKSKFGIENGQYSYFRTEAGQWLSVSDTRVWWGGISVCWLLRCNVPEEKGRKCWLLQLLPTKSEIWPPDWPLTLQPDWVWPDEGCELLQPGNFRLQSVRVRGDVSYWVGLRLWGQSRVEFHIRIL